MKAYGSEKSASISDLYKNLRRLETIVHNLRMQSASPELLMPYETALKRAEKRVQMARERQERGRKYS